jgi:hypothetical protein
MKETKDTFNKNCKLVKREIEEHIIKWKDLSCSWIGRTNIVKMAILTKSNLHVYHNPYQNSNDTCTEIEKSSLRYTWKHKKPEIAKAILSKKSNGAHITVHNFKLYYRTIKIRNSMMLAQNRQEDQWIRIEYPDINLHIYSQLTFDKGAQNTFNTCCSEN